MDSKTTHAVEIGRFLRLEQLLGLGFWEWDHVVGKLTYCSKGYAAILDTSPAEVMAAMASNEQASAFLHPDDIQFYFETEQAAYRQGQGMDIEYRAISATGELKYIHEVCEVKTDSSGEVIKSSAVVQDFTERKLIEQKLAKTLADARLAEQVALLGTYEWDWVNKRLVTCSEAYANMFDMSCEEAVEHFNSASDDLGWIHPDDLDNFVEQEAAAVQKFANGYDVQYRQKIASGGYIHILERCVLERDTQGKVLRSMGSIQDISERVHLEEQLRQVGKLEALGQLSGGIAHDFNNMLMIVAGNIELATDSLAPGHPAIKRLNNATEAVGRGATLTRRLLAFSRTQSLDVCTVDLAELLGGMNELLRPSLGETVDLEIPAVEGVWLCLTDAAQLENAILNLAVNARDAMPDGGSLFIGLKRVVLDEAYCANFDNLTPGNYIRLVVSDDGKGMSAEVMSQVFDPFFTTKDVGKGTGLGLSMVYGFITQTGGHVVVYSELGIGTEIKLFLPDANGGQVQQESTEDTSEPTGNNEILLVVEDEAQLRKLTVTMLNGLGYRTLEAETAAEALILLDTGAEVDLIFSDVVLPGGTSGLELTAQVSETYPDIKVLLASGYNPEAKMLGGDLQYLLLEKPYSRAILAQSLSNILNK